MDRYIFMGNLGEDAKVAPNTKGNGSFVNFTVAVDKSYKDQNGTKISLTKWVNCSWFVDTVPATVQYMKKGGKVVIEGEPKARPWVDKDQLANAALDVRVFSVHLAGSAPTTAQGTATASAVKVNGVAGGSPGNKTTPPGAPETAITDPFHPDFVPDSSTDDLPF